MRCKFDPWVRKTAWRRKWQPTPVFLPEKSHGERSLVGYSPWGLKRVGHKPEQLSTHAHTGEMGDASRMNSPYIKKYFSEKKFPRAIITIITKITVLNICYNALKWLELMVCFWIPLLTRATLLTAMGFLTNFRGQFYERLSKSLEKKLSERKEKIVDQIWNFCFLLGHLSFIYNVIRIYFYIPLELLYKIYSTFLSDFQNLYTNYIFLKSLMLLLGLIWLWGRLAYLPDIFSQKSRIQPAIK